MKKIFHILMSAVVALGVVACDNEIDDNLGGTSGESVSIYITIEQPTKVDFTGETDPVKGAKIGFEEGDELYVVNGWADSTEEGYYFTYTKQEGGNYVFTCTAEGVSGIVGDWKGIYYLGGRKQAIGAYGNTAEESVNGVFMHGAGTVDSSTPIALSTSAILKFKSDDPVTITSSSSAFYNNGSTETYTTQTTGEYIYLPLTRYSGTYTFTFSIKGREIGKKTLILEPNQIYNFGYLETPAEEVADGDAAGIEIAIDGVFTDWANITKNVATLPAEATEKTNIKTLKAYADANNIYGYVEFAVIEDNVKFVMGIDLDNDASTGSGDWLLTNVKGCELIISSGTFIEANTFALYSAPFKYAGYSVGDKTMVTSTGATSIGSGCAAVEFAIAREQLNDSMISPNIGLGITTYGSDEVKLGTMPYADNTALVIPVHN